VGRSTPQRGKTGQSFLFALAAAIVGAGLAIAINLLTNNVPKTWHWASNGWFLVAAVAVLTVAAAVLAWRHQSVETSDRPSPRTAAGGTTVSRWRLWTAVFATLALAVGLALLSRLDRSPGANQRAAVLIVAAGLAAAALALAWQASSPRPAPMARDNTDEVYAYLIWLAKMMRRQHQTVFYPDWLTPEWLPNRKTRWPLRNRRGLAGRLAAKLGWDHTSTGIVGGRLAAVIGAMAAAPLGALAGGLSGAVLAAAVAGTILGVGVGVTFGILLQVPAINRLFVPLIGSAAENRMRHQAGRGPGTAPCAAWPSGWSSG
jgi:hypothetical protein